MAGMSVIFGMSIIMIVLFCFFALIAVSFVLGTVLLVFFVVKVRKGKKRISLLVGAIVCYLVALPLGIPIVGGAAVDLLNPDAQSVYQDNGVYGEYSEEQGELLLSGKRYVDFWSCNAELIEKGTPIASVETIQSNDLRPIFQVENGAGSDIVAFSKTELSMAELCVLDSQLEQTKAYYNNLANYEFTVHYSDDIRGLDSTVNQAVELQLDGAKCNLFVVLDNDEDIEKQDCPESYQAAEIHAVSKDGYFEKRFTILKSEDQTYFALDPYNCYSLPEELNGYLMGELFNS